MPWFPIRKEGFTPMFFLRSVLALFFFFSGFSGLLYQLVWMRLAYASFGINTPVMSVVISVFMVGLAIGSLTGGKITSRLTGHRPVFSLFSYAGAEGLIGLGAFAVPALFSWGAMVLLPLGNSNSFSYLLFSSAVVLLALLPWCICMGATFPLMMDFMGKTFGVKDSFSFLYAANLFGALTGVAATALILIECLGFHRTLAIGALFNFTICAGCLIVGIKNFEPRTTLKDSGQPPVQLEPIQPKSDFPAFTILFLTGFICLAMEVIWTRDFTFVLKTQVYSFASLLFTYLLSTFLGSFIYRMTKAVHTLEPSHLLIFTFCFSLFPLVIDDPQIHHTVFGVLASIVPFCLVLGYLSPLLVDRFSGGNTRQAARFYAVNLLGCILGPLAASYLLLPFLGVKVSMIFLSALLIPFLRMDLNSIRSWPAWVKAVVGFGLGLLLFTCGSARDYENAPGTFYKRHLLYRDYAATVISGGEGLKKRLFVNGIAMTDLNPTTKVMAHLPLAFLGHPAESALDICFGMGTTYRSLLSWGIQCTVVELVPSVFKSFGYFFEDAENLVKLPNGHMVVDDGRRFLNRTHQKFDVITIDPPPPIEAAGSSLLYSAEFLEIVKKHLTEGGILQIWMPLNDKATSQAIARTVMRAFPYVRVFLSVEYVSVVGSVQSLGYFFIASSSPIPTLSPKEMADKLPLSAQRDLLEWSPGVSCEQEFEKIQHLEVSTSHSLLDPAFQDIISDDKPFNEYYLLRRSTFLVNIYPLLL